MIEPDAKARPRNYMIRACSLEAPDPGEPTEADDPPEVGTSAEVSTPGPVTGGPDVPDVSDISGGRSGRADKSESLAHELRPASSGPAQASTEGSSCRASRTATSPPPEVGRSDAALDADPKGRPKNVGNVGNVGSAPRGPKNGSSGATIAGDQTSETQGANVDPERPGGNGQQSPPDTLLAAEERAAILEHEAGLPREAAERKAGLFPDDGPERWGH